MAAQYLDILRAELPDLFEDIPPEPDWDDDWHVWRMEDDDSELLEILIGLVEYADDLENLLPGKPPFLTSPRYPGGPLEPNGHPDAIERSAFYLPYHFYHPTWWGIYILFEGWFYLARRLYRLGAGKLSPWEAVWAARETLFRHELLHHGTEVFATRLEIAYRLPFYRLGIRDLYDRTFGTDKCNEEALANGFAIVKPAFSGPVRNVVTEFVRHSPRGYRRGVDYSTCTRLDRGMHDFAEELIQSALPSVRKLGGSVWSAINNSFTGRIRNTSQAIYLLPRRSPLCARLPLKRIAPMTVRKLKKGLKRIGKCEFDRQGGKHEIWRCPSGTCAIPRHAGDLAPDTLRRILTDAGIDMSLSQFESEV